MNNHEFLLHLSLVPGAGPATVVQIVAWLKQQACDDAATAIEFLQKNDASSVYSWGHQDFQAAGFTPETALKLVAGLADRRMLDEELPLLARHGVDVMTMADTRYPTFLSNIYAPPLVLYVRGTALEQEVPRVAVVGSRAANTYAQHAIDLFVPHLAAHGIQVVSGGAMGVDLMAHHAALQAGTPTIAVFGSGLLALYPREAARVSEKIIEQGGAIVSPFPLRMEPIRGNFPARNRVIAGLSQATIVVQAAAQSGSLITARYALEQGRTVCAVPGRIDDPLSAGTHGLLKQGATVLHSTNDLDEALGLVTAKPVQQSLFTGPAPAPKQVVPAVASHPLLKQWPLGGTLSTDQLLEQTSIPLGELQNQLFELQLTGKVVQNFMGGWQRVGA